MTAWEKLGNVTTDLYTQPAMSNLQLLCSQLTWQSWRLLPEHLQTRTHTCLDTLHTEHAHARTPSHRSTVNTPLHAPHQERKCVNLCMCITLAVLVSGRNSLPR